MYKTLEETVQAIETGALLHISGSESLLRRLPRGNWIGGSTEYFMMPGGGAVMDTHLAVQTLPSRAFAIRTYTAETIGSISGHVYEDGVSVVILPFDSEVLWNYSKRTDSAEELRPDNIIGWVSGQNLDAAEQVPCAVDGRSGTVYGDRAVALHVRLPAGLRAQVHNINFFKPDMEGPLLEFLEDSQVITRCLIDGEETLFANYLRARGIGADTPLMGDYFGKLVNVSIKTVIGGRVNLYAPVFKGIEYRMAKPLTRYADAFRRKISAIDGAPAALSFNCFLNFLYGGMEGEDQGAFYGPVGFGEVAGRLVNHQTLVYLQIT
ncbi:hypothetical protein LJC32_03630 [Oscillospiraceae bacterium OttesenSCG-928-F05]|nr:hypothetical protein [Oscillospiraceae bacterium OttesenSCG-928-F05]